VLIGNAGIPSSGRNAVSYTDGRTFDAVYEGAPLRVAAVGTPCAGCEHVVVLVAETMLKRQRSNRVVVWLLAPLALMLVVTCSAIFFAIRRNRASAGGPGRAVEPPGARVAGADSRRRPAARAVAVRHRTQRPAVAHPGHSSCASACSPAAAAHQLRTPLTALRLGMARARNSPDLESTRAVLDELAQVTEHTGRLVATADVAGPAGPEARGDIDRAPVDLRDVARDVCGLFAEVALEQHVDLELQVPGTPIVVVAQSELLVEALANLIDNALKSAGRKGQVLVAVIASPPSLRICDNGPGIKAVERKLIFERYARGTRPRWEGTGLGLAIVQDVATLHGATVTITDGELGGACFSFEFAVSGSS